MSILRIIHILIYVMEITLELFDLVVNEVKTHNVSYIP